MAAEKDFELLDDYLANRMPESERAAFESQLNNDSELLKEFKLQQQVIESVKKARLAELKTMLNNVPVPPVTGTSLAMKIAAGITLTAVVGAGLYFLMSLPEETEKSETREVVVQPKQEQEPEPQESEQKEQPIIAEDEKAEETKKSVASKKKKKQEPSSPVIDPKIEVFDPTADLDDESSEPTEGELLSEDDRISTEEATIFVEIDSTDRRHDFHYKLEHDNLKLYGHFEENLYEILEFFSDNKRTAFLYYKKAYYYIKETERVTALAPVQDPALLNKLRQHRTKN